MNEPSSIDQLSRLARVSDAEAADVFGVAGRAGLRDAITSSTPGRDRRRRRPLVLAVALVVAAVATGAGWALTQGSARETTAVDCQIDGVTSVIDATSGNPAADCAVIWPAPVPALQAYDNGIGGVVVIPKSETAPANWTPIESQDVALIELQESFDDTINGLNSACFSSSAATAFAQQGLDRLGLTGWTVNVRPTSQTGQLCYWAFPEAGSKTVTVVASAGQQGQVNGPPQQLADSLRPLTHECLSLSAMQSAVEQRATALGMSQTVENDHNYQLKSVPDDGLSCATVTESGGGTTVVIVRGPPAS